MSRKNLSLYQDLEDSFYDKFPDDWEKEDLYALGDDFIDILYGVTDRTNRSMYIDEEVTCEYIKRGKRKIWETGKIYKVAEIGTRISLGLIKLIDIVPGYRQSILIFLRVDGGGQINSLGNGYGVLIYE